MRSPHLDRSVEHASFYPCTVSGACHGPIPWGLSWFTAMFMHGSWEHIAGNMLFLGIFGKNVEDAFGHVRYLAFYIAGGFVAAIPQAAATLLAGTARPTCGADARCERRDRCGAGRLCRAVPDLADPRADHRDPRPVVGLVLPRSVVPVSALRATSWPPTSDQGGGAGAAFFAHVGRFVFGFICARVLLTTGRVDPNPMTQSDRGQRTEQAW